MTSEDSPLQLIPEYSDLWDLTSDEIDILMTALKIRMRESGLDKADPTLSNHILFTAMRAFARARKDHKRIRYRDMGNKDKAKHIVAIVVLIAGIIGAIDLFRYLVGAL